MSTDGEFLEWKVLQKQYALSAATAVRELLARCDQLAAQQIARVVFRYEGSGDSGEELELVAFDAHGQAVTLLDDLEVAPCYWGDDLVPAGYASEIPVRWIGEQHVREDFGWIPSMQDWFKHIWPEQWMHRGVAPEEDEVAEPVTLPAPF